MPHAVERFAPASPSLMQLKTLAAAISPRKIIGSLDRDVEGIAYDSRRVQRDFLFVALRGEKSDGHQFIEQAIEKGASSIVIEQEVQPARATCLVVENTRYALADLGASFYDHPMRRLKMAAVTGTNGKTTTTFLLKHICEKAGLRCGLIGTVRYEIGDRVLPAVRTTPESLDIQELLAKIVECGMQSRGDGGLLACDRAGSNTRTRMGRRRIYKSDSGSSRFSWDDGELFRSQSATF